MAFIAVGTGVGMGIVVGGRILRGAHGAAGELGLLPWVPTGWPATEALEPFEGSPRAPGWQHAGARTPDRATGATSSPPPRAATSGEGAAAAGRRLAMASGGTGCWTRAHRVRGRHRFTTRRDRPRQAALAAHDAPAGISSALGPRAGLIGAVEAALDAADIPARRGGALMFLKPLLERNPSFVDAAVELHRAGQLPANSYVLDLDAVRHNAARCGPRPTGSAWRCLR